jgi:hypothetical protein
MKKIFLSTTFLLGFALAFSQNSFCDSIATATIASDVLFARHSQLADSGKNHFVFDTFQSIADTTASQSRSQLVVSGLPVTFIDVIGTFPGLYDHHLWDRAHMGCPTLVQGENGVVIRLRYKAW